MNSKIPVRFSVKIDFKGQFIKLFAPFRLS